MIKSTVGQNLDALIHRLFPFLFWGRLDPNTLTVTGALVSTGAAAALAMGSLVLGGILILVGGFFDLTDGVVARHRGISTRFGGFLDSTLDRWVDMVLMAGASVHFAREDALIHVAGCGLAMAAMVLVSYSKARAELELPSFEIGWMERGERIGLLAAGAILGFLPWAVWAIALGSLVTAWQRIDHARREMAKLDVEASGAPAQPAASETAVGVDQEPAT
ncbi:MAG: CDP-alcohol phosphatidyltransferase family protein [Myxococcota bacterium]